VGDDNGVGTGGARRASPMATVGAGASALPRSAPHAAPKSRSKLALRRLTAACHRSTVAGEKEGSAAG